MIFTEMLILIRFCCSTCSSHLLWCLSLFDVLVSRRHVLVWARHVFVSVRHVLISQWCVRVWFRVCMNVRETHIVLFLSCTSHAAISFGRSRTGQKFWSCAVVLWTEVPGKRALARWNGCVCLCDYLCLFLWILKTICSTIMFFHFLYGPHEKSWTKTILYFL